MKTKRFLLGVFLSTALSSSTTLTAEPIAPTMTREYHEALRSADSQALEKLLRQGASANARDDAGNTPLILAGSYCDPRSLQILLDHGADVHATNLAGATALVRAASDPDKVALLLARGAEVNVRSALGNTPLHLAARPAISYRAVALLLEHGADPNATNHWGATPLMAAAAGGDIETIRLLLARGADVNAQPGAGHDAFILGGARTALMWAAFRGDLASLRVLLDAGADVNAMGMFGTALSQAVWADRTEAAKFLIERGAKVDLAGPFEGYTPLHWAASTEHADPALVRLLLGHGANPNVEGGESIDAFLGTAQTPLMLAKRRGDTAVLAALAQAGATNATADRLFTPMSKPNPVAPAVNSENILAAINRALPPLQHTSIASKQAYVRHASKQDCTSCHQQHLPMAALGWAKKQHAAINTESEQELIKMVSSGELKNAEVDWEALFHPDAVQTKGYTLLAFAAQDLPASDNTDAWVHHLSAIQGQQGEWHNNLPRPPIQTDDIGATALAVQALRRYPLPGQKVVLAEQVARARQWLSHAKPDNTDSRIYQLLGLAWAGESVSNLQSLAQTLLSEQRADGGWAQLPGLKSDAYATGQAVYALQVAAGFDRSHPAVERGLAFLLRNQLEDGTWHVRRRAFPFQPTMDSGFPHGRDSWISAAATSWAVMALSVPSNEKAVALQR